MWSVAQSTFHGLVNSSSLPPRMSSTRRVSRVRDKPAISMLPGSFEDPADIRVGQRLAAHLNVVLALQALLQHLELQGANHADDNAFHAGAQLAEDLHRALHGELLHALHKLLAL